MRNIAARCGTMPPVTSFPAGVRLSPTQYSFRRTAVVATAAAVVLAACGGSDDPVPAPSVAVTPSEQPSASPQPTASPSEAATSSSANAAQADATTRRLARAGTLQRGDYPRGWAVASPAAAVDPAQNEASCSYQPDGPEAELLAGAIRQGPHMQLREAPGYAHSQAYVFADADAAAAWIDHIDSRAWARCVREQLQAFQDEQDSGGRVRLHTRETPSLGQGGFSSYASFSVAGEGGEIQAFTDYQFYVLGRVGIRLGLDIGALSDEQYADYTAGIDQALQAAYARVYELEPEVPAS